MKKNKIFLLILICHFHSTAIASKLSLGLRAASYSKKIVGVDSTASVDGEIVSNSNINYGFEFEYSLSKSLRLLGSYESRSLKFDNSSDVIEGSTEFESTAMTFGFKWILFSRTALRFLYNIEQATAFKVNSGKAKIYTEASSYITTYFDQILYLGSSVYSGFRLGFDISSSGNYVSNRSATRYGVFVIMNTFMGQFESFYEIKNITKESSSLDFTEKDSILNFVYRVRF